ncbi:MAG: hypothetical protein HYT07_03335 [Candidatus Levybacteria bacterium]|nr:hypothetical protein [Candidatus Levybacteria bacterium]
MLERAFARAQQLIGNSGTMRQHAIAQARKILQDAGVVDPIEGDLPQTVSAEVTSRVDLRKETYGLLKHVRNPTTDEKEALEEEGIIFFPVGSKKSYDQVVNEDKEHSHFSKDEQIYASLIPELKKYVLPVAVEVGLKPSQLALPGSFGKSRKIQLEMIDEYSKKLQVRFPDIRAIMLPATAYAQADMAYKAKNGKLLFRKYFARALDNLSEGEAAHAGRDGIFFPFNIGGWNADLGEDHVGAVPAVVFVRNK